MMVFIALERGPANTTPTIDGISSSPCFQPPRRRFLHPIRSLQERWCEALGDWIRGGRKGRLRTLETSRCRRSALSKRLIIQRCRRFSRTKTNKPQKTPQLFTPAGLGALELRAAPALFARQSCDCHGTVTPQDTIGCLSRECSNRPLPRAKRNVLGVRGRRTQTTALRCGACPCVDSGGELGSDGG